MKILWVIADKRLSVHNGGNIRAYRIPRYLAVDSTEVAGCFPSVVEHLRQSDVVSSTVRAEGLDVRHGRDIMLDGKSFAHAVIMLLRDRELRRQEKAEAETAARYDWPAVGDRFSGMCR